MQKLLENLSLLASIDIPLICETCGINRREAIRMISELKTLNLKPGHAFDYEVAVPLVPDVFVTNTSDGGWKVELNSDNLPRILVNRVYFAKVHKSAPRQKDKTYIRECLQSANWVIKSLNKRANTILSVVSELILQQEAFLNHGVRHLRPLNLRTIAESIGVHESTVSRVISNKYVAIPRGMFALKFFFSSALVARDGGESFSSESVRDQLRNLIEKETVNAVLSDHQIVDILHSTGIGIARRTVAKYRDMMGIPSSICRRRIKRMEVIVSG